MQTRLLDAINQEKAARAFQILILKEYLRINASKQNIIDAPYFAKLEKDTSVVSLPKGLNDQDLQRIWLHK